MIKPEIFGLEEPNRLAWSLEEVARQLGISKRHASALNSSGRLPRPVKLGRRTLWHADEVREWLAAGAPSRERWELMKGGDR